MFTRPESEVLAVLVFPVMRPRRGPPGDLPSVPRGKRKHLDHRRSRFRGVPHAVKLDIDELGRRRHEPHAPLAIVSRVEAEGRECAWVQEPARQANLHPFNRLPPSARRPLGGIFLRRMNLSGADHGQDNRIALHEPASIPSTHREVTAQATLELVPAGLLELCGQLRFQGQPTSGGQVAIASHAPVARNVLPVLLHAHAEFLGNFIRRGLARVSVKTHSELGERGEKMREAPDADPQAGPVLTYPEDRFR